MSIHIDFATADDLPQLADLLAELFTRDRQLGFEHSQMTVLLNRWV